MPATLFRIWRFDDQYHLCVLQGETETPTRELMATNGVFRTAETDVRRWFEEQVQRGMPHHVCLIEGHHAELIRRIGRLLGMVGDR
jgi:L-arabinose isomerase